MHRSHGLRFSIIVPCLNRGDELRSAIKSCIDQTFADFELIVVDDGSNPSLEDVCRRFEDKRIRYHRNSTNLGVSHSRNIGLDCAAGEYVSFLDSDDIYLPKRLELLDHCIRATNTPPSIVFHRQNRCLAVDDAGMVAPARLPAPGERLDNYVLIWGNFIQTNTFIIERGLARKIRFDIGCRRHEDTKFIIECWLTSPNYIACNEILSVYRDFRQTFRLSKQEGYERLLPLLRFAENSCTLESHIGFAAYASAELLFFRKPAPVLTAIWQAYRAGVPKLRCAVYLARSMIGTAKVDHVIQMIRLVLLRSGLL